MRQHRSVLLVTGSLLMGLAGCAGDSMKSSSEPPLTAPIAQAESGKDQPPSEEVQERGLPMKSIPGLTAPSPSGVAPPAGFVGATDNITKLGLPSSH